MLALCSTYSKCYIRDFTGWNSVFRYLPQDWSTDTGGGGAQGWGSSCKAKQPAAPTPTLGNPTLASCLPSEAQGSSP